MVGDTLLVLLVFESFFIFTFVRWADKTLIRAFLPVVITGVFVRFLVQFIWKDWLRFWDVSGDTWYRFWMTVSSDLTIWAIAAYFYLQFHTNHRPFLYVVSATLLMSMYLYILLFMNVYTVRDQTGNIFLTLITTFIFFFVVDRVWFWLKR